MNVYKFGDSTKPPLVCIHGLMGDVRDFDSFIPKWQESFYILVPEIAVDAEKTAYAKSEGGKELTYVDAAKKIKDFLDNEYPNQAVLFTGISLGGKICIEFAGRYPESFKGALVTDVGYGPLCNSDLYDFLVNVVPSLNLNQLWKDLRVELKNKIPDNMLRILIQNLIEYKDKSIPKANWKSGMKSFPALLRNSELENQVGLLEKIKSPIVILKASHTSAICEEDYLVMQKHPCFFSIELPGASHFIQINNKNDYLNLGFQIFELLNSERFNSMASTRLSDQIQS